MTKCCFLRNVFWAHCERNSELNVINPSFEIEYSTNVFLHNEAPHIFSNCCSGSSLLDHLLLLLSFSSLYFPATVKRWKSMILTDVASSELSGCQSVHCCQTLTFLPSVSHHTPWQAKADFWSFDYNSWIIHTPCTCFLQGLGVGLTRLKGIQHLSDSSLLCGTHFRPYFNMKSWL